MSPLHRVRNLPKPDAARMTAETENEGKTVVSGELVGDSLCVWSFQLKQQWNLLTEEKGGTFLFQSFLQLWNWGASAINDPISVSFAFCARVDVTSQ